MNLAALIPDLPPVRVRIEPCNVEHAEGLAHAFRDEGEFPRDDHWPRDAGEWSELIELQCKLDGMTSELERMMRRDFASQRERLLNWTVFAGDRIVGEIEVTILEDGMAELWCTLDPAARGRSIAFRACSLALEELAARPDVRAISVHPEDGNTAGDCRIAPSAMRLIERLGFREVTVIAAGRTWGTFHELPMIPARAAFAV